MIESGGTASDPLQPLSGSNCGSGFSRGTDIFRPGKSRGLSLHLGPTGDEVTYPLSLIYRPFRRWEIEAAEQLQVGLIGC